jgi:hypothetical protein
LRVGKVGWIVSHEVHPIATRIVGWLAGSEAVGLVLSWSQIDVIGIAVGG